MIKSFAVYAIAFIALFFVVQLTQEYGLELLNKSLRYELWDVNKFFAVASLLICANLKLLSTIKSLHTQLGFIYLPTLFIKGGLFFLMFKSTIFQLNNLTFDERLNLLIPLFLFLALEVFFVIKIIKEVED